MSFFPRTLVSMAIAGTSCAANANPIKACPIQDIAELCLMQNSLDEMEAWANRKGWNWTAPPELESKGGVAIVTDTDGGQYRLVYQKFSDMISVQCAHSTVGKFVSDGDLSLSDCSNVVESVERIVPEGTKITTVANETWIGKSFHFEKESKRFQADVVVQRSDQWTDQSPPPAIIETNMIHLLNVH